MEPTQNSMSKVLLGIIIALLVLIVGGIAGLYTGDLFERGEIEFASDELLGEFGEHYTYHLYSFDSFSRVVGENVRSEDELYEYLSRQGYELFEDSIGGEKEIKCHFDLVLQSQVCVLRVVEMLEDDIIEVIDFTEIFDGMEELEEFEDE